MTPTTTQSIGTQVGAPTVECRIDGTEREVYIVHGDLDEMWVAMEPTTAENPSIETYDFNEVRDIEYESLIRCIQEITRKYEMALSECLPLQNKTNYSLETMTIHGNNGTILHEFKSNDVSSPIANKPHETLRDHIHLIQLAMEQPKRFVFEQRDCLANSVFELS